MSDIPFELQILVPRCLQMDQEGDDVSVLTGDGKVKPPVTSKGVVGSSSAKNARKTEIDPATTTRDIVFKLVDDDLKEEIAFICSTG